MVWPQGGEKKQCLNQQLTPIKILVCATRQYIIIILALNPCTRQGVCCDENPISEEDRAKSHGHWRMIFNFEADKSGKNSVEESRDQSGHRALRGLLVLATLRLFTSQTALKLYTAPTRRSVGFRNRN